MSLRVIGMDISLRHGALVELSEDNEVNHWYYTDMAGVAKRSKTGFRIPPAIFKETDFQKRNLMRLVWARAWFRRILRDRAPDIVALEDYAYDAPQGAHQLGELGCVAKVACWDLGVKLRLHAPGAIKMFGADNGNADKNLVKERVQSKWNIDWNYYDAPAQPGKKKNTEVSEDLTDAYVLAKMALSESLIRSGRLTLEALGTDKERQTFLRATKAFPVNVLCREWICKEEG